MKIMDMNAMSLLVRQIDNLYGITDIEKQGIEQVYEKTIYSLMQCFKHINNKYYQRGEVNPLHIGQWTMFLYKVAYFLHKASKENVDLCNKIYALSKMWSSADLFYEVELPDIYFFDHPQGSVMGRAKYEDYFSFSQGCTVGNNKGKYPQFGKHVSMFSDSKILGNCNIGDYVIFSANSYVLDMDIPSNSIVFGQCPNNTIHSISKEKFLELTGSIFVTNC